MPYRRLPKTDQARIRTLKAFIQFGDAYGGGYDHLPVEMKTIIEARNFLIRFEAAQKYYKHCLSNQVNSSLKVQKYAKKARLYVSHFIQVFNLAVIRSEIKPEYKTLYGLEPENTTVPDLSTDILLYEWAKKIIKGEQERLRRGGAPIYNPAIAKVIVHFDIFNEGYSAQKNLQTLTSKSLDALANMRERADEIILDSWNQIEQVFEHLPSEERLNKCKRYGIIYYYRKGENNFTHSL